MLLMISEQQAEEGKESGDGMMIKGRWVIP